MNPEYALLVLKERKENLLRINLEKLIEKHGEVNVKKMETRIKHQVRSLDFAIEVLETYMD